MPISRKEFESGEPDPSLLVTEFLRSNPEDAYTVEELIAELSSRGIDLTGEEMQSILKSLESRRRIEAKTIDAVIYYIYSKALGFRPS